MAGKRPSIDCPIYKEKEWVFDQLTRDLNTARDPRDKLERAEALKQEMTAFLDRHGDKPCEQCQFIAETRIKIADLAIRICKLKLL